MKILKRCCAAVLVLLALPIFLMVGAIAAAINKITGTNKKHWLNRK